MAWVCSNECIPRGDTGWIFTDWTHNYSNAHPGFLRSICSLKTALSKVKVVLKGTPNLILFNLLLISSITTLEASFRSIPVAATPHQSVMAWPSSLAATDSPDSHICVEWFPNRNRLLLRSLRFDSSGAFNERNEGHERHRGLKDKTGLIPRKLDLRCAFTH
jgi:hypothetical protein